MYQIIYTSTAKQMFTDEQLVALLEQSRNKNLGLGITGMLLYFDGHFMQLIEGGKEEVKALYRIILNDERHTGIIKRDEGVINRRSFGAWSMGFRQTSFKEIPQLDGYADVTAENFLGNACDRSYGIDMLSGFYEQINE